MRVVRFVLYVAFIFFDPPGWWRMSAIQTSIRPPIDAYILPCPSIVGRRFRIAPLTTNDRCGFRGDRVICLSAHVPARPRHRLRLARVIPSLRKLPALHSWLPRQSHYLWRLPFRFAPTPLLRRGVGPLHFIANPKPPLAFPTRKDRHLHSGLQSAHCRYPLPSSHPLED